MNNSDKDSHNDSQDEQIPELTQSIPVLDQMIPELTDRIDLAIKPSAYLDDESSTDTVEDQLHRHRHEMQAPEPSLVPVLNDSVSNNELEIQQWQIEQQAEIQAGEWQDLSNIESAKAHDTEVPLSIVTDNSADTDDDDDTETETEAVFLSDDVEDILHASWQRLEDLIMTHMPAEIAGSYLSLLEQQIYQNKVTLSKELSLLDRESLNDLLDEFDIDRGF